MTQAAPLPRLFALWMGVAAAALPGATRAGTEPADRSTPLAACDIDFHVTPRHDTTPRTLDVRLSFDAGGRPETFLRLQPDWAGITDFHAALHDWQGVSAGASVAAADERFRWKVTHAPTGRVQLSYRVRAALPDPDAATPQPQEQLYRPQVGADWFQFFGYGVLPSVEPWGDDRTAALCVTLAPARPADAPGASGASAASGRAGATAPFDPPAFGSLHAGRGTEVRARVLGSPLLLRDAFYGGGPGWRVAERALSGGTLHTAVRGQFAVSDADFADQSASLIDSHRRFWGDATPADATDATDAPGLPPQWLVLTPNHARGNVGGTLVRQAAVLHAEPGFSPASGSFEFLVGHENLHQWIPDRFGGRALDPKRDVWNYWFSEGFTNYYTHRLLLASGLWTLDRYAANLTATLQSYWRSPARNATVDSIAPRFFTDRDAGRQMYTRGELLALRWDRALRERGHAGLDPVMRGLLLPANAASAALAGGATPATERVLTALAAHLGPLPARDVAAYAHGGDTVPLDDTLAGPCLRLQREDLPRWSTGFDDASFDARTVQGVRVNGPAYAAGLRDGQKLRGWSIYGGDTQRDVELTVVDEEGAGGTGPAQGPATGKATGTGTGSTPPEKLRTIRYRPVDGTENLPTARVRPGAAQDPACLAWQRR